MSIDQFDIQPPAWESTSEPAPRAVVLRHPRRATALAGATKVYLLVDPSIDCFKVGISVEPLRRSKALPQGRSLDWARSRHVVVPTRERAFEVERALHKALAPFHARLEGSGGTEWFRMEAYPLGVALLQAMPNQDNGFERLALRGFGGEWDATAQHNLHRMNEVAALWMTACQRLRATVRPDEVIFHGFRPVPLAHPWRLPLLNLETYRFDAESTRTRPVHLVKLLAYDSTCADDLVLSLQPLPKIRPLPAGRAVVAQLQALLLELRHS